MCARFWNPHQLFFSLNRSSWFTWWPSDYSTSHCVLIMTLFQRFTKKVNNRAKLWAKKRETEGGREWEQCALCADIIPLTSAITWTGLLTLRACWQPASIAAAQYTADKCWTTRRLQHEGHSSQALLAWYGSRVEVHSYYTTYACLLRTGQHLCVCLSYKQVLSVMLNAKIIVVALVSDWRWPAAASLHI